MPADAFGAELLSAHNQYRAAYGVPALKWSSSEAFKAKTWAHELADKSDYDCGIHDSTKQNISISFTGDKTGQEIAEIWYSGVKDYDYDKPGLYRKTNNFTNMVWASTTHLGSAKVCKDIRCIIVVNYLPSECWTSSVVAAYEKNVKRVQMITWK